MSPIAVIPTYNERENVEALATAVLGNLPPEGRILFCDDNSPDGTGAIIDRLAADNPRILVLHRAKKEGLGRAYVAGFARALELGATHVIEMDCDFSHDPADVPRLLEAVQDCDVAIGSRYVKGGRCVGWPFKVHLPVRRPFHPPGYGNARLRSHRGLQVLPARGARAAGRLFLHPFVRLLVPDGDELPDVAHGTSAERNSHHICRATGGAVQDYRLHRRRDA